MTPYGGGTSVVGGVEPRVGHGYRGTVTVDLGRLDRVLEIDETSMAARIEAGARVRLAYRLETTTFGGTPRPELKVEWAEPIGPG